MDSGFWVGFILTAAVVCALVEGIYAWSYAPAVPALPPKLVRYARFWQIIRLLVGWVFLVGAGVVAGAIASGERVALVVFAAAAAILWIFSRLRFAVTLRTVSACLPRGEGNVRTHLGCLDRLQDSFLTDMLHRRILLHLADRLVAERRQLAAERIFQRLDGTSELEESERGYIMRTRMYQLLPDTAAYRTALDALSSKARERYEYFLQPVEAMALALEGRREEALKLCEETLEQRMDDAQSRLVFSAHVLAAAGQIAKAGALLDEIKARWPEEIRIIETSRMPLGSLARGRHTATYR